MPAAVPQVSKFGDSFHLLWSIISLRGAAVRLEKEYKWFSVIYVFYTPLSLSLNLSHHNARQRSPSESASLFAVKPRTTVTSCFVVNIPARALYLSTPQHNRVLGIARLITILLCKDSRQEVNSA